jgi:hypothetical protein
MHQEMVPIMIGANNRDLPTGVAVNYQFRFSNRTTRNDL